MGLLPTYVKTRIAQAIATLQGPDVPADTGAPPRLIASGDTYLVARELAAVTQLLARYFGDSYVTIAGSTAAAIKIATASFDIWSRLYGPFQCDGSATNQKLPARPTYAELGKTFKDRFGANAFANLHARVIDGAQAGENKDVAVTHAANEVDLTGALTGAPNAGDAWDIVASASGEAGRLITFVDGVLAGENRLVKTNVADTLVPDFDFSQAPGIGDEFILGTALPEVTAFLTQYNADLSNPLLYQVPMIGAIKAMLIATGGSVPQVVVDVLNFLQGKTDDGAGVPSYEGANRGPQGNGIPAEFAKMILTTLEDLVDNM